MKYKILNTISYLTLFLATVIVATFIYWSLYPYKPMVVNKKLLPVLTKEVKQGDVILFEMDYCKYTNEPTTISRRFIDGIIYALPDVKANNKEGCRVSTISEAVPDNLPSGEYIMSFYYSYKVNPIRNVIVSAHTEKFKVIE